MEHLLEIRGLTKRYDGFALENVNLAVPAGSIVGLIGANGAGKTTTIKTALGLIHPDAGEISLFGESVTSPAAKQRTGVVFDACMLPEYSTVRAAGTIMAAAYERWDATVFSNYVRKFGLPERKAIRKFSRGMGMKLSLACALSHSPDLLILDEATAGLDPLARDELLDELRTFVGEGRRSILMSSHITSDFEKIADYIVCIDRGRIAFAVEKDAITDMAGIAQCRAAEFDRVAESNFFPSGEMRFSRHAYGTSVLVPDRFAFAQQFPDIALDRASIDSYLNLVLKGETR